MAGRLSLIVSGGLALGIFMTNLRLTPNVAGGVLYALPLMLASRAVPSQRIIQFGAAATLLIGAGFFYSPAATPLWIAISNRVLALLAIWTTAAVAIRSANSITVARQNALRLEEITAAQAARLHDTGRALRRTERLAELGWRSGTITHELRNPLGVLSSSLSVIEAAGNPANQRMKEAVDRARRAIARCEQLISQHLDFARSAGHRPQPVVLDEWLSTNLDDMRVPQTVVFKRELGAGSAVAHIDQEALRRALINLVDNACQAMTGQQTQQTLPKPILSMASTRENDVVKIIVADNGPGIPPDILARLPEPLFSTKASGTGLGLSVVQQVMQDHAGGMRIDSEPGAGTSVTLWLPVGKS